ncbi:MAG: hypothetical protein H7318_07510 [Oligoflexus sp.]|nr:hypothetical protein [Oligoflexus sp.]
MKFHKQLLRAACLSLGVCILACEPSEVSQEKITSVAHSPVKRQSIGNCWLYAQATWLESMLKTTTGEDINVSETYWTYWDLYGKLEKNEPIPDEEFPTGGGWKKSVRLINTYGWLKEDEFIPEEKDFVMSKAQACAVTYIQDQGKEGGTLFDVSQRTPELIRQELDKGFSCQGKYKFDMNTAYKNRHLASSTMLVDVKTREEQSLETWLGLWKEASVSGGNNWGYYEGKKLPTEAELVNYKKIEQRIKRALNDHQPVLLSWFVSFNAANEKGLFNLSTLAQAGELGHSGGHMIVLYDYTVTDVPGRGTLPEGDLSDDEKTLALSGNLEYLVVKNSWGADRPDRPWLGNGYSRLSWDYLTGRYDNEGVFSNFIRGVVLPPGY